MERVPEPTKAAFEEGVGELRRATIPPPKSASNLRDSAGCRQHGGAGVSRRHDGCRWSRQRCGRAWRDRPSSMAKTSRKSTNGSAKPSRDPRLCVAPNRFSKSFRPVAVRHEIQPDVGSALTRPSVGPRCDSNARPLHRGRTLRTGLAAVGHRVDFPGSQQSIGRDQRCRRLGDGAQLCGPVRERQRPEAGAGSAVDGLSRERKAVGRFSGRSEA